MSRRPPTQDAISLFRALSVRLLARLGAFPGDSGPDRGGSRSVLITSSRRGEGKTFIARGLAQYLAELGGSPVLLVDGNFDNPELRRHYGIGSEHGFSDGLESGRWDEMHYHAAPLAGLWILPAGNAPKIGALFQPAAVAAFLDHAARAFRIVIIDGSVITLGVENIARQVDGVVLVVDSSSTRREVVRAAIVDSGVGNGKLMGVVLNKRLRYLPRFLDPSH